METIAGVNTVAPAAIAIKEALPAAPGSDAYTNIAAAMKDLLAGANLQRLRELLAGFSSLGLGAIGKRVLESTRIDDPHWPAIRAQWLAELGLSDAEGAAGVGATGGAVPWKSRQRRFQANLEALRTRWPELASAMARHWEEQQGRYQLYLARDGEYQISDLKAGHIFQGWASGFRDHRLDRAAWKKPRENMQFIAPITFDGAGFGWLILHVLQATQLTALSYSCAVYWLEPDLAALAMLLHLHDVREWITSPRLRIFAGDGAAGAFQRALQEEPSWTVPQLHCANPLFPRSPLNIQAICEKEAERRAGESADRRSHIEAYYKDKDAGYWRERFDQAATSGSPLRVLGITTRYSTVLQHSMAELGDAIRAAGHDWRISKEPDDQSIERPDLRLIEEFKPDLILGISRMRHENPNLPANVPFLSWDQDALPCMRTPETARSINALTYVAGISAYEAYQTRRWPGWSSIFCHLGAATHRYHAGPVATDLAKKYACDLSFVSNAATTPEEFALQLSERWQPSGLGAFFEAVAQRVIAAGFTQEWDSVMLGWAREACENLNVSLPEHGEREMLSDMRLLADRTLRHTVLLWVAAYARKSGKRLRLHGAGWEKRPEFAEFAAGPIAQGEDLRALYQASKINLQITRWGFTHSRSLDGLAAGGFFLTNHAIIDYGNRPNEGDTFRFARRAMELGCWTRSEVEASADPVIRELWPRLMSREWFTQEEMSGEFSALRLAAGMPLSSLVFESLPDISFTDAASFEGLANRYLADDSLRTTTAEMMRAKVQEHYSYDARWKQFFTAIRQGLHRWTQSRGHHDSHKTRSS